MKASVIICTLAAVAGTSALVHYGSTDDEALRETKTTQAVTAHAALDARSDVRRLEAEINALRRELAHRPASSGADVQPNRMANAQVVAEQAGPDPMARSEALADGERRFEDHMTQIATHFSNEVRDARFAIGAGEALRTTLESEEFASMPVQNVDCRSSTCRLEISDDGSGVVSQVMPMLAVRMAETLPNIVAQRLEQPGGRATLILFMSK